jgi:hypothetical protein
MNSFVIRLLLGVGSVGNLIFMGLRHWSPPWGDALAFGFLLGAWVTLEVKVFPVLGDHYENWRGG